MSFIPFNPVPKDAVLVKVDVIHILNDIHNNPHYATIGRAITPQGLIALLLSMPTTPALSERYLAILEEFDPTGFSRLKNTDALQILCEQSMEEIDAQVSGVFRNFKFDNTPFFWGWQDLSCLNLIAHRSESITNEIQEQSFQQALRYRFYDGGPVEQRGAYGPLGRDM